jgi:hypothetical protein
MRTLVLTPLLNSNQESFAEEGTSVPGMACGQALSSLDSAGSSERNNKRTHSAGPLKDVLPLTFRLMRVQGLPSWTNTSAVTIQDVIQVSFSMNTFSGSYLRDQLILFSRSCDIIVYNRIY